MVSFTAGEPVKTILILCMIISASCRGGAASSDLTPIAVGDLTNGLRYGYVDADSGETVIGAHFSSADTFSEGLAVVGVGGTWINAPDPCGGGMPANWYDARFGYINTRGETVIPMTFISAKPFHKGRALVRINRDWGYYGNWAVIDAAGRIRDTFTAIYPDPLNPQNPFSIAQQDSHLGFINQFGEKISPIEFEEAQHFSEGYAAFKRDGLWGYLDAHGREVIPPRYMSVGKFSEGVAPVMTEMKFGGYYSDTVGGLTDFFVEHLWGYIDSKGTYQIRPAFSTAEPFAQGLGFVSINGCFGYIEHNGSFRIPPIFEGGFSFPSEGGVQAVAYTDTHYSGSITINSSGEILNSTVYPRAFFKR